MAESIAILFKNANWNELSSSLAGIATQLEGLNWEYPTKKDCSLNLYAYDSWKNECEYEYVIAIEKSLGAKPLSILCLEFRRSVQDQACKDAKLLCNKLLSEHRGIVDDALGRYWDKRDIATNSEFLKEYRQNLQLEPAIEGKN